MKTQKTTLCILAFLTTLLISFVVHAQIPTPPIKVNLSVSTDDVSESRVHSLIAREIRTFDDVEIVDSSDASYEMIVIVLNAKTRDNNNIGFVASLLITQKIISDNIKEIIATVQSGNDDDYSLERKEKLIKEFSNTIPGRVIDTMLTNTVTIEDQQLFIDPDLESLTKRIVAEVDYKFFDNIRRINRQIRGKF